MSRMSNTVRVLSACGLAAAFCAPAAFAQLPSPTIIAAESTSNMDFAWDLQYAADGNSFFVTGYESQNLQQYDATTGALLKSISVPGNAAGLALTADGSTAYVGLYGDTTVVEIDLTTDTITDTIDLTVVSDSVGFPSQLVLMPNEDFLVANNGQTGNTVVVDLTTNTAVRFAEFFNSYATLTTSFGIATRGFRFSPIAVVDNDTIVTGARALRPGPSMFNPSTFNVSFNEIQYLNVATGVVNRIEVNPFDSLSLAPGNSNLQDFTVSADGSTLFVSNTGGSTGSGAFGRVIVSDTATETVTGVFDDPGNTFSGSHIVSNNDGTRFLVIDSSTAIIVDVNKSVVPNTFTEVARVNLGTSPGDVVVGPGGDFAFTNSNPGAIISFGGTPSFSNNSFNFLFGNGGQIAASPTAEEAVSYVSTQERFVILEQGVTKNSSAITLFGDTPESDALRSVAISADGDTAVGAFWGTDNAGVFDLTTGTLVETVAVGDFPQELAISPDGTTAIVPNDDSTFASLLDLTTVPVGVTNVNLGTFAARVSAFSPDGSTAYVLNFSGTELLREIDVATATVTRTVNVGDVFFSQNSAEDVNNIAVSPDGTMLAVASAGSTDEIRIVDTTTFTVVDTIADGFNPREAAFSPDSTKLAVANETDNTVTILDVSAVPGGGTAAFFDFTPVGGANIISDTAVTDDPTQVEWLDNDTLFVYNSGSEFDGSTSDGTPRGRAYSVTVVEVGPFPSTSTSEVAFRLDDVGGQPIPNELIADTVNGNIVITGGIRSASSGSTNPIQYGDGGFLNTYDPATGNLIQSFSFDSHLTLGAASADGSRIAVAEQNGESLVVFDVVPDVTGPNNCPGDSDNDGDADADDFINVLVGFGTTSGATREDGDFDGDGDVDADDFIEMLVAFGSVYDGTPACNSI
ncbi:MAG: beta-propeller fold lactonase family protein [Planctomycetota bacterium]